MWRRPCHHLLGDCKKKKKINYRIYKHMESSWCLVLLNIKNCVSVGSANASFAQLFHLPSILSNINIVYIIIIHIITPCHNLSANCENKHTTLIHNWSKSVLFLLRCNAVLRELSNWCLLKVLYYSPKVLNLTADKQSWKQNFLTEIWIIKEHHQGCEVEVKLKKKKKRLIYLKEKHSKPLQWYILEWGQKSSQDFRDCYCASETNTLLTVLLLPCVFWSLLLFYVSVVYWFSDGLVCLIGFWIQLIKCRQSVVLEFPVSRVSLCY